MKWLRAKTKTLEAESLGSKEWPVGGRRQTIISKADLLVFK